MVLLDSLHLGGLLQFSTGIAVKTFLASLSSDIHAVWPHREKRRAWLIAERYSRIVSNNNNKSLMSLERLFPDPAMLGVGAAFFY